MATGANLGTRQLDVLGLDKSEVAAFGNTGSNTILRLYDVNNPGRGYLFGVSNSSFAILRGDNPALTQVNIGTVTPQSGVQLQVQGTMVTSTLGVGTTNPQARLHMHNGDFLATSLQGTSLYISSNLVGIGTSSPTSTLHVVGDSIIKGTLTASRVVDLFGGTSFQSVSLYGVSNNTKMVTTNDSNPINRILFSFSVSRGNYIINGNIPYVNYTSVVPLDTVNWAVLGLYQTTPAAFSDTLQPVYTCPLVAIGGAASDYDSAYFTTLLTITQSTPVDYVVAVNGLGHQLQFGGTGIPVPRLSLVPANGLGLDDNISVRQGLQLNPIRRRFVATANQQNFSITEPGIFSTNSSSNVDVFVNGIKGSNISVVQNVVDNQTTYVVTLPSGVAQSTPVEVTIWPTAVATNYYSSGYLYQKINNFSAPFLNVDGGGIRAPGRLVVDGDLFVSGNVYSGCNTSTFLAGVQWEGSLADIGSNVIGTYNLADGCITTSKIADSAITTRNIANGAVTTTKIANFAVSNIKIADRSITESKLNLGSTNIGVGVAAPRANWHVNGTVMTNTAFSLNNTNQNMSYDFSQANVGNVIWQQLSNVEISISPTVIAEARSITVANGSSMSSWGTSFTQPNTLYRPTYISSGGYMNGAYVKFNSQGFIGGASNTYDLINNTGITCVALLRFDATTAVAGDVVFTLYDANDTRRYITLERNTTNATALNLTVSETTGSYTLVVPNVVITNEWALYSVIIDRDTNVSVYKNGKIAGSGTSAYPNPTFQMRSVYTFTPLLSQNIASTGYGRISYAAFYAYQRMLTAEEMAVVSNFMLQGWVGLSKRTVMPVTQINPAPYIALDNNATSPVPSMDVNASMRIHALPANPLWSVDAFSSPSIFLNPTSTLPTFDRTNATITFTTSKYLELGPRMYNVKSVGLTFVTKFAVASAGVPDEILLYLGIDPPNVVSSQNYIRVKRDGNTSYFKLDMSFNGLTPYSLTSSTQIVFGQVYTLIVVIDDGVSVSIWINGVKSAFENNLLPIFNDIVDSPFTYSRLGGFNGTIYQASIYNRPFSETEIAQAHTVMMSDISTAALDIGSRTGRSALTVSKNGTISSLQLGNDRVISGLLAHLTFDNHLYDTAGNSALSGPIQIGSIQFNNRGRVGPSLIVSNRTGNVAVQNAVAYTTNAPTLIAGKSITAWVKPYEVGTNTAFVFSLVNNVGSSNILQLSIPATSRFSASVLSNIGASSSEFAGLTTYAVTSNQWHHVAVTLSTTDVNTYVNGTLQTTAAATLTPSSLNIDRLIIGCKNDSTLPFNGEIDDVRIYNKTLSLLEVQQLVSTTYRNNLEIKSEDGSRNAITMSPAAMNVRTPLQLAQGTTIHNVVTNSSNNENALQFSFQSYQLRDMTGTNQNISLYGDAVPVATSAFDSVTNEGSLIIPGTSNSFITLPYTTTQLSIATGMTVECWVNYKSYINASVAQSAVQLPVTVGSLDPGSTNYAWSFGMNVFGQLSFAWSPSTNNYSALTGTTTMALNTWYHIATSINNGTATMYLNGVLEGSPTVVSIPTMQPQLTVGSFNMNSPNMIISNIRYSTASLYTANFSPSTTPLAVGSNTLLLLRCPKVTTTPISMSSTGNLSVDGSLTCTSSFNNMNMFRNKIINGHMKFDQINNGIYTIPLIFSGCLIDRWNVTTNTTTGRATSQRITLSTLDTPFKIGFTNSLRITVQQAFTNYSYFNPQQRIEPQFFSDLAWTGNGNGSYATVSFWFKAKQIGKYQIVLRNFTASVQTFIQTFTVVTSDTWQFVSVTIPPPPGLGTQWTNTGNLHFQLMIANCNKLIITKATGWYMPGNQPETVSSAIDWLATVGNYIEFTGVQFEKGQVATPFEFRPDNVEFQLCRRYYEVNPGLISVFPGCEASASKPTQPLIGTTVALLAPKRTTAYTIYTADTTGTYTRISAKFANMPLITGITPTFDDKLSTSFYLGVDPATFSNVSGFAYSNFNRGSFIFKVVVTDELI